MKAAITAVLLAKNEEQTIARAIESVSFCDEILVIDDNSTDKTVSFAKKHGATVIEHSLDQNFAAQRNFALSKALHSWVLFLDSDEEITKELENEILKSIESVTYDAYYLRRRDFFWNTELKHGETQKARNKGIIRLIKRGKGTWKGSIHEEYHTAGMKEGLTGFINHYPHQTVARFLQEINVYSTLRATELFKAKKRTSWISIILYPLGKFLLTYILYLGFLDGAAGFAYSFFMSFHSFLVRSKLYQYQRFGSTIS